MARFYRHPTALIESDRVGAGTRVWAFAHVLEGAVIGRESNIGDHCYVEGRARIGDRVTIKNGVAIWDGVTIENDAFVGPGVTFTNDLRPRSRAAWALSPTRIGEGATIGANATILCGITIGPRSFIGAGSVVTRDVPAHGLVFGNPARLRGHVCACGGTLRRSGGHRTCARCGLAFSIRGKRVVPATAARVRA